MATFKNLRLAAYGVVVVVLAAVGLGHATARQSKQGEADWSFNATIIEACSCPLFCPCYFNTRPAVHASHGDHGAKAEHFCRFNRAFKVNRGNFGAITLDGITFWMAGDLGGDFSKDQVDWGVLTFEPSVTKGQRDALSSILHYLYPVKWNSLTVTRDGKITWNATRDRAEARLDGGKTAELLLKKAEGMTDGPVVIKNLKYDGAPRNDGFILMPDEVEAYRVGDKAFEFKGTNGFMITVDMTSKDVKK